VLVTKRRSRTRQGLSPSGHRVTRVSSRPSQRINGLSVDRYLSIFRSPQIVLLPVGVDAPCRDRDRKLLPLDGVNVGQVVHPAPEGHNAHGGVAFKVRVALAVRLGIALARDPKLPALERCVGGAPHTASTAGVDYAVSLPQLITEKQTAYRSLATVVMSTT